MRKTNMENRTLTLKERIDHLKPLLAQLKEANDYPSKLSIIDSYLEKQEYAFQLPFQLEKMEEQFAVKSILAIGQGEHLFQELHAEDRKNELWMHFLQILLDLEQHYDSLGGIIGYHLTILHLILEKQQLHDVASKQMSYCHPPGFSINEESEFLREAIHWGIAALPQLAEIYPVGGAGDRLNLHDDSTGEALPAAILAFGGRTLLEGLIRDLQAREYLHFKLFGKEVITPIAMMTSHEKNNHHYICQICEKHGWFGRQKDLFYLFTQPLVPVVTLHGDWVKLGPLQLMVKPGGHGVIWKFAYDSGVIDKLLQNGRKYALVRQINNPIAGLDHGLTAFTGIGQHQQKVFGFASCPRLINTSEGMDVLLENAAENGYDYKITNIEYTEFEQKGIQDVPAAPHSSYSIYPANTNILFVDLSEIKKIVEKRVPIPGMIINMKNSVTHYNRHGIEECVPAGRLESTMQNIADYIVDHFPKRLSIMAPDALKTYVTYNDRHKTISVAKKSYIPGESPLETPEGCFFELMQNHAELFSKHCGFQLPELGSIEEYLRKGPSFFILYHPALGPHYEIIAQKIQGGSLAFGSELQLEIAELELKNLILQGSLIIEAESIFGHKDAQGIIHYSERVGKCILRHVSVQNSGIDRTKTNHYWKNQIVRKESLRITLHGNAEFIAEDVTFKGAHHFEVEDGHRLRIDSQGRQHLEKISDPSWRWSYVFNNEGRIVLNQNCSA